MASPRGHAEDQPEEWERVPHSQDQSTGQVTRVLLFWGSHYCLSHANPEPKIWGWETEVLGQMQATTEVKKSLEFNYNDGISRIYGGTQGRQERGISCHKNLQGSALYIIPNATRSGILQHREPGNPQLDFAGNTDRLRGGECPGQADARRPESGVDSEAMSYLAGALKEPRQGPGKA